MVPSFAAECAATSTRAERRPYHSTSRRALNVCRRPPIRQQAQWVAPSMLSPPRPPASGGPDLTMQETGPRAGLPSGSSPGQVAVAAPPAGRSLPCTVLSWRGSSSPP